MENTALQPYQFTLESAIGEWIAQKKIRTGSERTEQAYRDTIFDFRAVLATGDLDVLSNPIDVARVASLWANRRKGQARASGDVSPSTYNQRLAILSSFYTFVQEVYHLDIPNPIETVKKRPVQAYAAATPLDPENVIEGLEDIDRGSLQGMRDYALLAIALATGRRASELVGLRTQHIKLTGKREPRITLTFERCKGNKVMKDTLDVETSMVLLEYLHALYGKNVLTMPEDSPVWVSFSRQNKGKAIAAKTLSHLCERYLDTPKVHALRHTFAVGMMRSGAPITELAGRLGHTDIKITGIYAKEILKDDNPYAEKLTARFGIKRRGK